MYEEIINIDDDDDRCQVMSIALQPGELKNQITTDLVKIQLIPYKMYSFHIDKFNLELYLHKTNLKLDTKPLFHRKIFLQKSQNFFTFKTVPSLYHTIVFLLVF